MIDELRARALPTHQRRTFEELADDLDLTVGDVAAKRSAYWTMLTLSAVIATAGIIADSTATVIGAMIIAPLSTPIMGMALAAVSGRRNSGLVHVVTGAALVVLVGLALSLLMPNHYDLVENSQVSGRTSPSLVDLLAAIATGLAGSVGLARRDVSAVLPGVAIAISLVPPLAVVGVCIGHGEPSLAFGALVLFLSNLLALVLAGILTFAALGYAAESSPGEAHRRPLIFTTAMLVLVAVPLAANTVATYVLVGWKADIKVAAERWALEEPGVEVEAVELVSSTARVRVVAPEGLPPVEDLVTALEGVVPDGIGVLVDVKQGREIDAGRVGS